MQDLINRVYDFNDTIVKIGPRPLQMLSQSEAGWLRQALEEEAGELTDSFDLPPSLDNADQIVAQADACGDAIVFALGGFARAGITSEQAGQILHAILDANFEKKAGVKEGRTGAADAVKPEGWVGPEERIREILFGKVPG